VVSPGTKDPPNIYRLIFFYPSIVFILRPRATAPSPLPKASSRLHAPSLAISASGPTRVSPIRAQRLDLDPPPSSSPSPRSDLDPPRPHHRHRSSSSSSPALSSAPRAHTPHHALVVPFTGALVVIPFIRALIVVAVVARSRGLPRHALRRSGAALFLATLIALPFVVLYRAAVWHSPGAS